MFGQILLICLIIWMLVLRWQKRGMINLSHKLGTIKNIALPFIGHAYMFLGSDEDRMTAFQKFGREAIESGDIISMWQGSRLYLAVADPVNAEFLLKNCLEKDDTMKCLRMLIGNGSVFAPVNIWRPRRKVLAPTFSPRYLMQFSKIFSRQSQVLVNQLKNEIGKGNFSIWKYITTYTMDSICETTLGVRLNLQLQKEQEFDKFLKCFEESSSLDSARLCQPWLHSEAVYKMFPAYKRHTKCRAVICQFVKQIIQTKRESIKKKQESMPESDQGTKACRTPETNQDSLRTFLELLIEASGGERGYTDVELQEETLVLVIAGNDTTAVGIAFASVMLSRHPDVQEKVYKEIQEVLGDSKRPIVANDLPKLKYLDAVIRETLRLYPSVPIIVRKVDKEVTLLSGIKLVKDCGIAIIIWAIHRNPRYWGDDAELFRPERFLDDPPKHPAAFIAFSSGPRACIGYQYAMMSMKTALADLLQDYRLLPASNIDDHHKPLRIKFDVMLRDVDDFIVQVEPRA